MPHRFQQRCNLSIGPGDSSRCNTRPSQPIRETLSSWITSPSTAGKRAIFLFPPLPPRCSTLGEPAYRPSTHISLNPFFQISYVKKVHRMSPYGGAMDSELVGQFESVTSLDGAGDG
ncbi:hypothetical protein Hypma_014589 [Hypsizygus marmoreus]|uniref:Uncharacterized protein n=1 Tax=Hypsizygus marmoreus TaxID=39966 RepID=A0A369JGL1_HYPMA|nr:hypothetical protein Hypma_014589 [Hypsizygus marmoreus]